MSRKLITLDELRDYCIANSLYSFQSKNDDEALLVSVPATTMHFEDDDQALYLSIKACHTKENANHSYIEDDVMEAALSSFQLKPILASIVETTDADGNSSLDFNGHDMNIEQNKMNPDEERINYIERIVGVVSPDGIYMEKDPDSDKSYVYANGIVFKDYTYAADILEQRQDVDVSVEIMVDQFSYDTKLGVLKIEDFKFSGITLLGSAVKPGMVGSHASVQDSQDSGAGAAQFTGMTQEYIKEFAQAVEKFNTLMARFSDTKEGENMTKFDELLAQYGVTEEDVTFEYENMSDEELEAAFAKAFREEAGSESSAGEGSEGEADGNEASDGAEDPDADPDDSDDPDNTEDPESDGGEADDGNEGEGEGFEGESNDPTVDPADPAEDPAEEYNVTYSVQFSARKSDFELSLTQKQYALTDLVNQVYESDNTWYCVTVYDNYLVMSDYWSFDKNYKQTYTEDPKGVFTLTGDRAQVYTQYLTQEEIDSLDEMRSNYSALVEFQKETEEAALHAQREEIINDARYAAMAEDEKFKALVANMDNYSVEDLTKEVKALHSDFVSEHPESINFSKEDPKPRKKVAYGMEFGQDDSKKPYGTLFDKKK